MDFRFITLRAVTLAVLTVATGCGRGPQSAEVEGVITCDGRPLANVEVIFLPDPEQGTLGPRSGGYTDDAGRYRLTTSGEGTAVGTCRVTVRDLTTIRGPFAATRNPTTPATSPKVRFADAYLSPSTTPLRSVVVQPGRNTLSFDLPGPDR